MRLTKIKLGKLIIPNNVFLAPLAGYTNAVFREMCYNLGAGLTFTEMISAKGLCHGNKKTEELLYVTPTYGGIKACQIFGSDPKSMRRACESEALKPFDIVDINMGCPMPKIYRHGDGSELLNNFRIAHEVISECKRSGKIITVKCRTGMDEDSPVTTDFAKMCEDAGADMITIHGRPRNKIYSGEVNTREIASAKNAVKIPVIANGGIFTLTDAERLIAKTGADGVMIARGALINPWLFAEFTGKKIPDKRQTVLKQIAATREISGERFTCIFMRKLIGFYIKNKSGAAAMRLKLLNCRTTEELESLVQTIDF